jgi:flagellar motor switch protein FliM
MPGHESLASRESDFPTPRDERSRPPNSGIRQIWDYDFRRQSNFTKDHLRVLQTLHERFARNLSSALASYLRFSVRVQLVSVGQANFREFVELLPDPSVTFIFRSAALNGPVILAINMPPIWALLDRLCSGPGMVTNMKRELTEIELALLSHLDRHFCRALGEAWSGVVELNPAVEDILVSNTNVARAALLTEIVVVLRLEFVTGDVPGMINLCLPFVALEPIMDQLHKQAWLVDESSTKRHQMKQRLGDRLLDVPLDTSVELGSVEFSTQEIMSLREGDVLRLPTAPGGELVLFVSGFPLFLCYPGIRSGNIAVEISRLADARQATE